MNPWPSQNLRRLEVLAKLLYLRNEQKSTIREKYRRKWQSASTSMRNIIHAGCAKIATTNRAGLSWPLIAPTRTANSTRATCARAVIWESFSVGTRNPPLCSKTMMRLTPDNRKNAEPPEPISADVICLIILYKLSTCSWSNSIINIRCKRFASQCGLRQAGSRSTSHFTKCVVPNVYISCLFVGPLCGTMVKNRMASSFN